MKLTAAVIGAGNMGSNHARVYTELDQCSLLAIVDSNANTANAVSKRYDAKAYTSYEKMLSQQRPDVVSIAVPTQLHADTACKAMEYGCHVLIEKPIAQTLEEGNRMIETARKNNVSLMVGHIERFNAAIIELKNRLLRRELGNLVSIETRRLGPYPTTAIATGVVLDLAVHDFDIIPFITGRHIERLQAATQCLHTPEVEDTLDALLFLENGMIGKLSTNWISPTKVREITVTGEAGEFHVNNITQDLTFKERGKNTIEYAVEKYEPLKREVSEFLCAIAERRSMPVTGEEGLEALRLALIASESGRREDNMEKTCARHFFLNCSV